MIKLKKKILFTVITEDQIFSYNFEQLQNASFTNAADLHKEITDRVSKVEKKVYLFFDEIQEVDEWERAINSFRVDFDLR